MAKKTQKDAILEHLKRNGNPMGRGAWWATVHGVMKESDRT